MIPVDTVIALLEKGVEGPAMVEAAEDIARSRNKVTTVLRVLLEAGIKGQQLLDLVQDAERTFLQYRIGELAIKEASPRPAAAPYRAPRTKKYGPAVHPVDYYSAEKLRAYDYGLDFEEGEAIARLPEREWLPLVGAVFRRDNFICTYCGADGDTYKLHCDHIAPISRGGPNELENLTTACDYCNSSKRDKLPHEWMPLQVPAK